VAHRGGGGGTAAAQRRRHEAAAGAEIRSERRSIGSPSMPGGIGGFGIASAGGEDVQRRSVRVTKARKAMQL